MLNESMPEWQALHSLLTPTEARLLSLLMQHAVLSDEQLASLVYARPLDSHVRAALEKHVDNMRPKLHVHGYDIGRVLCYGYVLLPSLLSDEQASEEGSERDTPP